MAAADFWGNREKAQEVVGRLKGLKAVVKPLEEALKAADDLAALVEMAAGGRELAAEVPGRGRAAGEGASTSWRSSRS